MKSFPNHRIDDESLKEYFYRGQDDNNKPVLDTIAGGSYGECPYAEIANKLEKIFRNNKAWSTRKSNTGTNTFAAQSTHNPITEEIREEMAQMRTELGLVLKHVTGVQKRLMQSTTWLNNHFKLMSVIMRRIPMQSMNKWRVSDQAPKAQIRIIGAKVKGTKVGTMVTTTMKVIMSEMETTTATTTLTGVTMLIETIGMGPMSPSKS